MPIVTFMYYKKKIQSEMFHVRQNEKQTSRPSETLSYAS